MSSLYKVKLEFFFSHSFEKQTHKRRDWLALPWIKPWLRAPTKKLHWGAINGRKFTICLRSTFHSSFFTLFPYVWIEPFENYTSFLLRKNNGRSNNTFFGFIFVVAEHFDILNIDVLNIFNSLNSLTVAVVCLQFDLLCLEWAGFVRSKIRNQNFFSGNI